MVCHGNLGSAVRRSQRLAGRRTPVGVSRIDGKCLDLSDGVHAFSCIIFFNLIVRNVTGSQNFAKGQEMVREN